MVGCAEEIFKEIIRKNREKKYDEKETRINEGFDSTHTRMAFATSYTLQPLLRIDINPPPQVFLNRVPEQITEDATTVFKLLLK